jgi:2,4-dichlorophenol 6-monooxygenase
VSTLDLVAVDRFVVLTSCEEWAVAAYKLVDGPVPLDVVLVGTHVVDVDGRWDAVSCLGPDGALLIRPDQHVAWRAATLDDDPVEALSSALAAVVRFGA